MLKTSNVPANKIASPCSRASRIFKKGQELFYIFLLFLKAIIFSLEGIKHISFILYLDKEYKSTIPKEVLAKCFFSGWQAGFYLS